MERISKYFTNRFIKKVILVYTICIILYFVGLLISPSFRTSRNFYNLLSQVTPLVIVGIAQLIVILSGGFDLSIGSIISLSNVAAASLVFQNNSFGIFLWILCPLAIGAGAGLINGFFISKFNLPPIIVTLATSSIFTGIALFWMPIPGGYVPPSVARFITGRIGFVSIPATIFLGVSFLIWFLLKYTQLGRNIYAIGGNEAIAYRAGVNIFYTKILIFSLAGLIASIVGIYFAARMSLGDPLFGGTFVMDSIAIAVIGGANITGGQGFVFGIIPGAFIVSLINNILNMVGVSSFYQYIVKGIILIIALTISSARKTILS